MQRFNQEAQEVAMYVNFVHLPAEYSFNGKRGISPLLQPNYVNYYVSFLIQQIGLLSCGLLTRFIQRKIEIDSNLSNPIWLPLIIKQVLMI